MSGVELVRDLLPTLLCCAFLERAGLGVENVKLLCGNLVFSGRDGIGVFAIVIAIDCARVCMVLGYWSVEVLLAVIVGFSYMRRVVICFIRLSLLGCGS